MTVVVLLLVGLVGVIVLRRRSRRRDLAGLNATKPQFFAEPPTRRLTTRRGETL